MYTLAKENKVTLSDKKLQLMKSALPSELAKFVLSNFSDGCVPTSVVLISKNMGIRIFKDSGLQDGVRALAVRCGMDMSISLRPQMSLAMDRFCIAHAMYEMLSCGDGQYSQSEANHRDDSDFESQMANRFAIVLLIPGKELKKDLLNSNETLKELAKKYEVSELALGLRAKEILVDC